MATPAEIIAARVNGINLNAATDSLPNQVPTKSESPANRPISDESAFPVLGGGSKPSAFAQSATPWGPGANGNGSLTDISAAAKLASTAPSKPTTASVGAKSKFKGSTIQEAFSLDTEDQLNVARPEFIKILTAIKTETKANIECTASQHTKKRTFLITGSPENVKLAKRLVIKKLTKPVSVKFSIPSKVRSRVIGPQGRTLKPIIQDNEVKIDVGHQDDSLVSPSPEADEDEDDIFSKTVDVVIEGDAEGCKRAKFLIMAIVKEETKNTSVKVALDELIKPLAAQVLAPVVASYPQLDFSIPPWNSASRNVIITGEREAALEAKSAVKIALDTFEAKLAVQGVPIPKVKHQFLPIEKILEEENVFIKLPEAGETEVKFIGEKLRLSNAQEKARQTTSQYKVEILDMSKAHKGNLPHVKSVAAVLTKNGKFAEIAASTGVVINPPSTKFLTSEETTTLPIEIVSKNEAVEDTKQARKALVSLVNGISPEKTLVITDIDPFFVSKVPETIKEAASNKNVEYVILGDKIVLFAHTSESNDEDFDFDDTSSEDLAAVNKELDQLRKLQENLTLKVLDVASSEQTFIAGPKNSTLRSIINSLEPNSVEIKLHFDGKKGSDNKVYVQGVKSEVNKAEKQIESALADGREYKESGGYKSTVEVPSFTIPRIIGKGGANINSIMEEFGVKLDILDEGKTSHENVTDKSVKSGISLAGNKRNVEDAKNHIAKLAKKLADDTLVRMRIEAQYHRRIGGPGLTYINRLQDKYNVRIRLPSANNSSFSDAPKSADEITIRGPSRGVAKAEEELKELYQYEKDNGFKATIKVPVKCIGRVIGKDGETINDIADGSGVEYHFKKDRESEAELGYTEVDLTGSKSALKEASQRINDIIEEAENFVTVKFEVPSKYHRDLIGPGGSVMKEIISKAGGDEVPRQKYHRLLSIPDEGSGSEEVSSSGDKAIVDKIVKEVQRIVAEKEAAIEDRYDLAKEKHKLIVGPGGSIRHSLQDEFNVFINIPRPNEKSTTIVLKGLPENIEKLKAKVEEMTKDNWNEVIEVPVRYHSLVSEKGGVFKTLKSDYKVEVSHGNLTRKALNLYGAAIPSPPSEAAPSEDEKSKFFSKPLNELDQNADVIPWRFIGDAEATAKAAKFVSERLEKAQAVTHEAWFYSKNRDNTFPRIIGPQGRKVNEIRKNTGAFITIPRSNDKHCDYIYIVGDEEGLEKSKAAIEKLL